MGLAERSLLRRIAQQLEGDGHAVSHPEEGLVAIKESDAVVAVLDGSIVDAETAAAASHAFSIGKPVLGLHGSAPLGPVLAACLTRRAQLGGGDELQEALGLFYEDVRPFAGRLVRDQIPRLVREAGHEVLFRELDEKERPAFLKRKVAEEAAELERASQGAEKEEIADVLEALEALIRVRGYDRDALRQVKQAKLKRRGGFERCFVVEATGPVARENAPSDTPRGASDGARADDLESEAQADATEIDWSADDPVDEDESLDQIDVDVGRRRSEFYEV